MQVVVHREFLQAQSVKPVIEIYAHGYKLCESLIVAIVQDLIYKEWDGFDADAWHCTDIQRRSAVGVLLGKEKRSNDGGGRRRTRKNGEERRDLLDNGNV